MKINCKDVIVKTCIRKDLGELDDLSGIEENKGSSKLNNIKTDGKNGRPHQRQSAEGSYSPSASTDVCEVSSSPINTIILGDCLEKLKNLPEDSVDQIVTDPPYGLKFMSKDWDKAVPSVEIWKECLRVLKPGAFAYIMSSPKQHLLHRNFTNIEDAGFKTDHTSLYWTYASGCPSVHNIGEKIDKKFGVERKKIARNPNSREKCDKSNTIYKSGTVGKTAYITEPATKEAKRMDGSYAGINLKPAVEVIIVANKPLSEKTYTDQALSNGKGITWLDDCHIPYKNEPVPYRDLTKQKSYGVNQVPASKGDECVGNDRGRYPANLLVSDDVLGNTSRFFSLDAWADFNIKDLPEQVQQSLPFLIVPKASKKEKNAGLDKAIPEKDKHVTVKPIKLMTYLITMGSREGDFVLDPFCGSGTTCMAAKMLKRQYVGIELSRKYHEIALKRIASVETILGEKDANTDVNGPVIENLKLIVSQQLKENPIGVKIALKYYDKKVGEIKKRNSGGNIVDFFRKEARRFVKSNKNGCKASKTKIEIRIKNTPEVAGLCIVIKNMVHGFSGKTGKAESLNVGGRNKLGSEIEDLMPYLPMLLEYA